MDTGYLELSDLVRTLSEKEKVEFRLALIREGSEWKLHTLIIDYLPEQENPEMPTLYMDYGSVHFIGGHIGGDIAAKWLHERAGEVALSDSSGATREFALPPINGQVNWQRFPGHSTFDFNRMPWPITRYDITGAVPYPQSQPSGFLLANGLLFYHDLKTAILDLVYKANDVERFTNSSLSPAVIVRIANTAAWLGQIKLSPTAISVKVFGTGVPGTQLTISGSSSVQFQHVFITRGSVECPLPDGIPSPLWIVLSKADKWLDYYQRDERWPIISGQQSNVIVEAGDDSTELAALIAQGEGLTTEFKEDVPQNHDQMLKTIAAFANGAGGVLLLGVKNDTGELVGSARNPDDLMQMIRNNVFPDPFAQIDVVQVDHRRIVAIYVAKGAKPPYGLHPTNTQYYVRRGATTFPARPEELRAIVLASQEQVNGPFAGYLPS